MILKEVEVQFTVFDVKTFTRKSGHVGQELRVESGSNYPAVIQAPDQEVLDLSNLKKGDLITAIIELGFTSYQCVSDNDKKYYKRVPAFRIKNII